jgi:two-component system, NarL family, sensor kinase
VGRRGFDVQAWAVAVVAVIALSAGGLSFWSRITTPSDLSVIDAHLHRRAPWSAEGVVLWEETAGALRAGDRVVGVEGQSMQYWADRLFDPSAQRPRVAIGAALDYQVERNGQIQNVRVILQPYPIVSTLVANASLVLLVGLLLGLTVFVFVHRPDNSAARAALLVAGLASWAAPWWLGPRLEIIDLVMATGWWRHVMGELADAFTLAAVLHFVLVFPRPRMLLSRHGWLVAAVYALPFILHGVWLAAVLPTTSSTIERARLFASPVVLTKVGYPIVIIVALIYGYRSVGDARSRQQLRWLAVTLGAGCSLYVLVWLMPEVVIGHPFLPKGLRFAVFLLPPLTAAAAISRHQAFDIELIINRALIAMLLATCLIIAFEILAGLLGMLIERKAGFIFSLLITAVVTPFVIEPLRKWIQTILNRLLEGGGKELPE